VTPSKSIASLQGMKMDTLEQSMSVMVRIVSCPPEGSSFMMKSIAIVLNGKAFSVGMIGNNGR